MSVTMPIQFTSLKNTEASEELRHFTTEKLEKLKKFVSKFTSIHIIFHVDKLRHIAEAKIHAPNLPKNGIFAEAESEDMYKTVDLLIDKLISQMAKYKEKATDHIG